MPWNAEERSRTQAQVMSGVLTVHRSSSADNAAISNWLEREQAWVRFEKSARRVLVGHPSRRRYRLPHDDARPAAR